MLSLRGITGSSVLRPCGRWSANNDALISPHFKEYSRVPLLYTILIFQIQESNYMIHTNFNLHPLLIFSFNKFVTGYIILNWLRTLSELNTTNLCTKLQAPWVKIVADEPKGHDAVKQRHRVYHASCHFLPLQAPHRISQRRGK